MSPIIKKLMEIKEKGTGAVEEVRGLRWVAKRV